MAKAPRIDQQALLRAIAKREGIKLPEKKARMRRYEKNVVTPEELAKLIKHAETPLHANIVRLLYTFALRCREALNLRIGDVDLKSMTLTLRNTKTEQLATMEIPPSAADWLTRWIGKRSPDTPLIEGIQYTGIYKMLNRTGKRVGIKKKLGTHGMRRSRATNEIDAGRHKDEVQGLLRHKSVATTEMYVKFAKRRGKALQENFELPTIEKKGEAR